MGRQILMELHIPGQQDGEFYVINMPGRGDNGWYTQATSFSWFRERELKRAFPNMSGLIDGMNWVQYSRTLKYAGEHHVHPNRTILDHLADFGVDINAVTHCNDLWDFYDKINYDRKAKKYR